MDGLKGDSIQTRIGKLRAELDLSQPEFAERLGMDRVKGRSTINNWESGANKIKADDLKKIAQVFNVSADWLLGIPGAVERPDPSLRNTCAYTGLDPTAAMKLSNMKGFERAYTSLIITSLYYCDLLGALNDYDAAGHEVSRYTEALQVGFDEGTPKHDLASLVEAYDCLPESITALRSLRFELIELFLNLLDEMHDARALVDAANSALSAFDIDSCESRRQLMIKEELSLGKRGGAENGEHS